MNDRTFDVTKYITEEQFSNMCQEKTKAILTIVRGGAPSVVRKKGHNASEKELAEALVEMHAGQAALFAAVDSTVRVLQENGIIDPKQGGAFRAILPIISLIIATGIADSLSPNKTPKNVIPFPAGGKSTLH